MERLTPAEIVARAHAFVAEWSSPGAREVADSQTFWSDLFEVYGLSRRRVATFEASINGKRADLVWPGVVLIEQKSPGKDLAAAMRQALAYVRDMTAETIPRWVVVSDFQRFVVRDLELDDAVEFELAELPHRTQALAFLRGTPSEVSVEESVTRRAATALADLYADVTARGYPEDHAQLLILRCAYLCFAEDAGIIDPHSFRDYVIATRDDGADIGPMLAALFQWIGTPGETRMTGCPANLEPFPHIPGWLFADTLPVPMLDASFRSALIQASRLDWARVDPAIFGTLFESVLSADDRRQTGSHYTSETDVLRVIRPTFLDDLASHLQEAGGSRVAAQRFRETLARQRIMDPAGGTGNFLSVTLRELVRLDVAAAGIVGDHTRGSMVVAPVVTPAVVAGIEIQGFAARIARLCLEITWHQSQVEARGKIPTWEWPRPFEHEMNVVTADALTTPWDDVVPAAALTAVVGNPPYLGSRGWSKAQRASLKALYKPLKVKSTGSLDLCAAWLVKGAEMMGRNPGIRIGLVTTNSLTQGQQVAPLWDAMRAVCPDVGLSWARTSFVWSGAAAVHCVLFGLASGYTGDVKLWRGDADEAELHDVVGPYMIPGVDVIVRKRNKPWRDDTPVMRRGSAPYDNGHLILSTDERDALLADHPDVEDMIRPFVGARELLYHDERWCLWLTDVDPSRWRTVPEIRRRVNAVKEYRLHSNRCITNKAAHTPTAFLENTHFGKCMATSVVTTNQREYLVVSYVYGVAGSHNKVLPISLSGLGALSTRLHMLWVKHTAGRLGNAIRYSDGNVYNTFPFPTPTPAQKQAIDTAAQGILDARAEHPDACLAELYDPLAMPANLRRAHEALDIAVECAYRPEPFRDDAERLSFLLERYGELVAAENVT
jgi:hypothetical protein